MFWNFGRPAPEPMNTASYLSSPRSFSSSLPSSSSMLMHLPMVASHTMLTPMATSLSISFCTMAFGRRNSGMP